MLTVTLSRQVRVLGTIRYKALRPAQVACEIVGKGSSFGFNGKIEGKVIKLLEDGAGYKAGQILNVPSTQLTEV